jgi:peroxiredoxin
MNRIFTIPACIAVAAVLSAASVATAAETPPIGAPAPAFALQDEEGTTHRLEDYRGRMVVLEWTNPECPYVQRHYRTDTMEKLSRQFATQVVWLAVNSTKSNTSEESRAWKQEQGFSYATLQDADGTLGRLYGAKTTPDMFVIDGEGRLRYAGAIDDDPRGRAEVPANYVSAAIEKLVAGANPDPSQTQPYGCSVKYK